MRYEFTLREWGWSLLLLLPILWLLTRRGHSWRFLVPFSGFWLYLTLLFSLVFFPIPPEASPWKGNVTRLLRQIEWVPFHYLFDGRVSSGAIRAEILGNIEATIPFGVFLPLIWPSARRHMLWLSWVPGLGIEMGQFLLGALWTPYRTVDVSDVLLNALGVMLGYGLLWIGEWAWGRYRRRAASGR